MGCCLGCCSDKKTKKEVTLFNSKRKQMTKSNSRLLCASKQRQTISGFPVNIQVKSSLFTEQQIEELKQNPNIGTNMIKLCGSPYSDFTQITSNLFLTGFCGITKENIQKNDIKCILSIYHEMPKFELKGIDCIRIPLEDSITENLIKYFDDICDAINRNSKMNIRTVVHCAAGARRSFTFVVAYLMKYKKMNLKTAFSFVYKKRRTNCPLNMNFFKQLMRFEYKLFGKNSVELIKIVGQSEAMPDFVTKEFPDLMEDTLDENIETIDDNTISVISTTT